jgi:hypothetical protein
LPWTAVKPDGSDHPFLYHQPVALAFSSTDITGRLSAERHAAVMADRPIKFSNGNWQPTAA